MPMLLTRLEDDNIAGPDFLNGAVLPLHPAKSCRPNIETGNTEYERTAPLSEIRMD